MHSWNIDKVPCFALVSVRRDQVEHVQRDRKLDEYWDLGLRQTTPTLYIE